MGRHKEVQKNIDSVEISTQDPTMKQAVSRSQSTKICGAQGNTGRPLQLDEIIQRDHGQFQG